MNTTQLSVLEWLAQETNKSKEFVSGFCFCRLRELKNIKYVDDFYKEFCVFMNKPVDQVYSSEVIPLLNDMKKMK